MDLIEIIKTNKNARKVIDELNEADIMRKFGITLTQARNLKHINALLIMKYDCVA